MIKPTIGRKVWFYKVPPTGGEQPEDATVCYVHSPEIVNLRVTDHAGISRAETSVRLIPSDTYLQTDPDGHYATWMPYQIGQDKDRIQR